VTSEQRAALGPAGEVLARNIQRIREGQRLTFVALSERLAAAGRPIAVLGLRRIERGERRVDVDDLLALAHALGVAPVDLLVPGSAADDEPYEVTPAVSTTAETAREWIAGLGLLSPPASGQDLAGLAWMPKKRATAMVRRYYMPLQEEYQRREVRRQWAEADRAERSEGEA
jgi:transcriptional regulator with XRE-family HTH domain